MFVSLLNAQVTILLFSPTPGILASNSPILFTGLADNPPSFANSLKSASFAAISNFVALENTSLIVFSEASIFLTIKATLTAF